MVNTQGLQYRNILIAASKLRETFKMAIRSETLTGTFRDYNGAV
jgi:hypothetical protein